MEGGFQLGPWLVQPRLNCVSQTGDVKRVEPKVMQVLVHLAGRAGEVVSKDELMRAVWPDTFVTDDALLRCVSELRKALEDDPREPRYIQTIPKSGYRLIAEVRPVEEAAPPAAVDKPPAGRGPRRKLVLVAGAVTLVIAIGYLASRFWSRPDPSRGRSTLAVLPFENLSGDAEQDYFSDGLTEELITELARLRSPSLSVMARSAVMPYKGTVKSAAQAGRELGADHLLGGSVRREGRRVRINVQLVRASDQVQLWAESYDRDVAGILAVQRDVARAVARQIRLALTDQEERRLASAGPVVPEAHEEYLKGRFFWNRRTPEDLRKALGHFQQAIEKDPRYAPALAGLADAHILLQDYAELAPKDAFPNARAAALRALEIDPLLTEAHTSLAMVQFTYEWDWNGAEQTFRRAIELGPSYVTAHHWYALLLATLGRLDEAQAEMRRARELDPLSVIIRTAEAWRVLAVARRYDAAIRELRAALELDPGFWMAHSRLGLAYALTGKYEQGIQELRQALPPAASNPHVLADLGSVYALAGKRAEARGVLRKLAERSRETYVGAYRLAVVHATLGEKDASLKLLREALEERDIAMVLLKVDPRLDPLRSDPRYRELLRRMRLPE